jgi:hypothetical protein
MNNDKRVASSGTSMAAWPFHGQGLLPAESHPPRLRATLQAVCAQQQHRVR